MDNQYWSVEFWRIALMIFVALVAAMISGQWLISFCLGFIGYAGWLFYKLYHFNLWLSRGARPDEMVNNDGIWHLLESRVVDIHRKSKKHKKRTSKLLKRFQGIIRGLPYATIVLNGNNEIDWANEKALDYLNIDIKKDRGQLVVNIIRSPQATKLFNDESISQIEISLPHNNERRLAVQFVSIQKDLKLILARDISDRINVQQMRKSFISNASHELRTPLTVIAGYLEMIAEDESLPEHMKSPVEQSSAQSMRMKSIIEDMLTLSRLEKSELDEESCIAIDVPSILHTICDDEIRHLSDKTHLLKTEIDHRLQLRGIESEIISVCNNLIENAVHHTPEQTEIKVQWFRTDDGGAALTVVDNGPGIPEEHIAHLTQRFYRVDQGRSRHQGGTGLGLSIVQHIIQRHGGRLQINSILGKGTTFTAIFPPAKVIDLESAVA